MSESPHAPAQAHNGSIGLVIASIAILLLLAALDQTIVSTALPTIVADLGGLEHLSWVVTAYILASTVASPLYGKLGDLYGRRTMVFVSVGLFLAGSMLCGISTSMTMLIISRAIQGLGGGGLFVLALSVVGDVIPPKDRGKIQGVFAAVFSASSVVGPLVGGWFVEAFSWHWIFFINVPFGALAVAGFAIGFSPRGLRVSHRIDWAGAATLSIALAGLTLVTSLGGTTFAWSSPQVLAMTAITLVSAALFLLAESRAVEPILPLGLFRMNVFSVTSVIGLISGAGMFGAITFLPLYLQIAKGISPTVSGLMLVPMTIGILSSSTLAGRYMGKTGRYRILPLIGTALLTAGMLLLAHLSRSTGTVGFGASILVVGLGMGCIFPVVTTAVQNAVPRSQLGTATAAGVMFRQIGGSLGVAAFGAIFTARVAAELGGSGFAGGLDIGPQMAATLPPDQLDLLAQAIVLAIHPIYWIAAGLGIVGFLFALMLEEVPLASRQVPRGE